LEQSAVKPAWSPELFKIAINEFTAENPWIERSAKQSLRL
jgi:hypothetical protein